jgi:hypothetical protein
MATRHTDYDRRRHSPRRDRDRDRGDRGDRYGEGRFRDGTAAMTGGSQTGESGTATRTVDVRALHHLVAATDLETVATVV